jgi:cell pole-organizing protein PopZ
MEDILASIRRILSDDDVKAEETSPAPASGHEEEDELLLEPSMMVTETGTGAVAPPASEPAPAASPPASLVAPEAAAAAASSVDDLVRTLSTDRSMMVSSRGPTIEDIVRQEIRPLLKAWLDVNLPPLVDRLVRTEIERVVGRART